MDEYEKKVTEAKSKEYGKRRVAHEEMRSIQ
jgi:hypothetical protein